MKKAKPKTISRFHQCSYCEASFPSNEERKAHEEICKQNGKTDQERFEARKRQRCLLKKK